MRLCYAEKYSVITTENSIVFQRVPKFDWDKWERQIEQAGDDPNQLTTEEICELVREVRRSNTQ